MLTLRKIALVCTAASLIACDKGPIEDRPRVEAPASDDATKSDVAPAKAAPPSEEPPAPPVEVARPPYKKDNAYRVVAIGDVHGDMSALVNALELAGLIDKNKKWAGAETVLVQTGDLLDRGDDEQAIIDLLDELRPQARAAGGDVFELLGNHETMNVKGDLRYVTPGGFTDFEDVPGLNLDDERLARLPAMARARAAALFPGGPYARRLASHNTIGVVNGTVFVHGGVLPMHVEYGLDKINAEVSDWMRGEGAFPVVMQGQNSPLWTRLYSQSESAASCEVLAQTLDKIGAKRMVVGHTPQMHGITSACGGKVWRIDVGMASHYGGQAAALEIIGDEVKVLTSSPTADAQNK